MSHPSEIVSKRASYAPVFAALGDPTRLALIAKLARRTREPLRAQSGAARRRAPLPRAGLAAMGRRARSAAGFRGALAQSLSAARDKAALRRAPITAIGPAAD